jgi:GWxTD domain-containing protein
MKIRSSGWTRMPVAALIVVLLAYACGTTKTAFDSKDLSYLYNPLKNSINPRYSVFNESEGNSVLSVKFFNNDLYFSEANPTGEPLAMILISVRMYNLTLGKALSDTAQYNLEIPKKQFKDEYLFKIPLTTEKGTEYIAEVKIFDKIRQIMVQAFVPFNTISEYNRYNFYARGHVLKNELLKPIIRRDEFVNLVYKNPLDTLFISMYRQFKDIPYPPTMMLPEKTVSNEPDTVIALPYADTLPMMFPRNGIFLCTAGRDINEGFAFVNFGTDFPQMTTPEEMIEPLAYLANDTEMEEMRANPKPKVALDEFWIKCGGNVEKARELIRIYYTRALYANYYFTSYKEGWRTDRGMIYLLYGPPDKLYKSSEGEIWGYLEPKVESKWGTRYTARESYLYFNFKKRDNKFSDNEYSMSRSETTVSYWDQAVLAWRKGIVFRLDNPADI